ncbi:type I polyketide synthase, partial [Goodfellowiella coeruleoviolacea]|uniref:type I polyketide synthase n=1 Tax=Goodfellowiella coeruleoviolacea TaxID=334858 RepID=UPI0020A49865
MTGRLSVDRHPWLADHTIHGTTLVPGTAFVELAWRAGERLGGAMLDELTLEAPLALSGQEVQIQLGVGASDDTGRRQLTVHSRVDDDDEWVCHARGALVSAMPVPEFDTTEWPPAGAELLDTSHFYDDLAEVGFGYGPAFQCLNRAWRRGSDVFAELHLPDDVVDVERFGVHPALLDSALHAVTLTGSGGERSQLPFVWNGVSLYAVGASSLRVRVTSEMSLDIADQDGNPVARVDSVALREVEPDAVASLRHGAMRSMYRLAWSELRVGKPDSGTEFVLVPPPEAGAVRAVTSHTLRMIQQWLSNERAGRLVFLTRNAVGPGETAVDPVQAAVWGLVRSAQAEHPDQFVLLDADDAESTTRVTAAALATMEPQLAIRDGRVFTPRLESVRQPRRTNLAFDPNRTVLVTGATGSLGRSISRHLVDTCGVRHLVLVSRNIDEFDECAVGLRESGATVTVARCDVAERGDLAAVLARIPPEHPLTAVVHTAGVLDDGVVTELTPERLDLVFRSKVDGAVHLHELTEDMDLSAFVLFSSAAATVGSPGQANYAAANAFLDALAQRRSASGLTASSLAWGPWQQPDGGMTRTLSDGLRSKAEQAGITEFPVEEGLALFDAALQTADPMLLIIRLDLAALHRQPNLAPPLRGLVGARRRRPVTAAATLARSLASMSDDEAERALLGLVRDRVSAVLAQPNPHAVDPGLPLREFGLDSLTAVELRNTLAESTGLRLPATLAFDHPTVLALVRHLLAELRGSERAVSAPVVAPADEPIAIVGLSCRYPGGVDSPERLWHLVANGVDAVTEFPTDRGWRLDELYAPEPGTAGRSYTRSGGFLRDAAEFDADFFGINPREARAMDPQQRLLLEISWEALERAGIPPTSVRGSRTGVFAGVMYHDYGSWLSDSSGVAEELGGYLGLGNAGSVASGRIAYVLGLEGPAVTIDTACSSSLVALHMASQALRSGECALALAGGVTVMSTPGTFVEFSQQRSLAADGRCKAFAAAADGTGWSEGAGMLVLERLSDAQRLGHRVLATIRGSAINQDGASNGLTAPNGPAQQRVILDALARAQLEPSSVDAVEGHGTGTVLGDPIEIQALQAAYGQDRDRPLWLGSLKSNIGHTQAAAGVAGVIKMVMAMRHGMLPRTLHVDQPTPHVDWTAGEVRLLTEAVPWPETGRARRAGVSSFGVSGTNAHVIVEHFPDGDVPESSTQEHGGPVPWVLSARTPAALRAQANRLLTHLGNTPELATADVGFTLAAGRAVLAHRAVVLGNDRDELLTGLDRLRQDMPASNVVRGGGGRGGTTGAVFVFSGQGGQWAGMAADLLATSPVFAERMRACADALDPYVEWSLLDVIRDATELTRVDVVQPALFAVMVSLASLWQSYGVRPEVVVGHSQGEIAAAVVAGGLSLSDGARLVALRSRALVELSGSGTMVAVSVPVTNLPALLAKWGDQLAVAAVNGPVSAVVSGSREAAVELLRDCAENGIAAREIPVGYASHSAQVERLKDQLIDAIGPIEPGQGEIPFVSTVTADLVDAARLDAEYWYRNLRETVRFAEVTEALLEQGHRVFVEVSPHPVLATSLQETIDAARRTAVVIATLRRGEGDLGRFLTSVAEAHVEGVPVNWSATFGDGPAVVDLPTYAFQRERYWLPRTHRAGDLARAGLGRAGHPLLGAVVALADGNGVVFTGTLALREQPWLADHTVQGRILVPAAALLDLALFAADQVGCTGVAELTLEQPVLLSTSEDLRMQVVVGAVNGDGERPVSMHTRHADQDGTWTRHACGTLTADGEVELFDLSEWPPDGAELVDIGDLYPRLAEAGFGYGPAFQGLRAVWRRDEDLFAEVVLPGQDEDFHNFWLHPVLLDSVLHAAMTEPGVPGLPFCWSGVTLPTARVPALRARLARADTGGTSLLLADDAGRPVVSVRSLVARPVAVDDLAGSVPDAVFRVEWIPVDYAKSVRCTVVDDPTGLIESINQGAPVPEAVVVPLPLQNNAAVLTSVYDATENVLRLLRWWLSHERLTDTLLVFQTCHAVGAGVRDLAGAAVWGLVRSAQVEFPGRVVLLDTDDLAAAPDAVPSGVFQLSVRNGVLYSPRLVRRPQLPADAAADLDPAGAVLITGGTGTLGGLIARNLVAEHGVRRLVLAGRRGAAAPGAAELVAELTEAGAEVTLAACDFADRSAVADLLASIDTPLTGIVHAAGVLADGVITSLDQKQLAAVLRPKVDGAWHLHELTKDRELAMFVLFSSAVGTLGGAGQANYAAANAFLDGLAAHRRANGLPAQSLAWGVWAQASGMTEHIDRSKVGPGVLPLSTADAIRLFDVVRSADEGVVVVARFNLAELGGPGDQVPELLRGLVPARRTPDPEPVMAERLAGLSTEARIAMVTELVSAHTAAVLGHSSAAAIPAGRAFRDLGFDSLTAVQLRNRLTGVTGLRLPATLVFDHPSAEALARHLVDRLVNPDGGRAELVTVASDQDEPVVIVGMACRLPGGVAGPEDLWSLLSGGADVMGGFPADRGWEMPGVSTPSPDHGGTPGPRSGGFLSDVAGFDADFFGISPREALAMDPQQRQLLEVSWEVFERAGIDPLSLRGSRTGVFAGAMSGDYVALLGADAEGYVSTGVSGSVLSGRVSYVFGFEGPAVTVDTACSSSLVAL